MIPIKSSARGLVQNAMRAYPWQHPSEVELWGEKK
jgi:hypothetical protein